MTSDKIWTSYDVTFQVNSTSVECSGTIQARCGTYGDELTEEDALYQFNLARFIVITTTHAYGQKRLINADHILDVVVKDMVRLPDAAD